MPSFKHENIIDDQHLQVYFDIACDEQFLCPAHWHTHVEVLYLLDGQMGAYVNSQRYELRPSDLLIIHSNDIHSTFMDDKVTYILLQIPAEYISHVFPAFSTLKLQEYFPAATEDDQYRSLAEKLLALKEFFVQKETGYELAFTSCLFSFLYELFKNYASPLSSLERSKNNRDIARIEEIIHYVRSHYTENLHLNDMADMLCISKEYFCRLFKAYTGQSFLEYLNTVRLVRFYVDLTQTRESITFLLEKHGITNYKVFMKLFKETYHTTPSKIRFRYR